MKMRHEYVASEEDDGIQERPNSELGAVAHSPCPEETDGEGNTEGEADGDEGDETQGVEAGDRRNNTDDDEVDGGVGVGRYWLHARCEALAACGRVEASRLSFMVVSKDTGGGNGG